jgi:hypothetical protein
MPAAQELLIDHFMAATTVGGCHGLADGETVVFLRLLVVTPITFISGHGLVAIQTIDAFLGMNTHFILMDNRVMLLGVTLCAFAAGLDERRSRLIRLHLGALPVNEKRADNQPKSDYQCNKNRAEGQRVTPEPRIVTVG